MDEPNQEKLQAVLKATMPKKDYVNVVEIGKFNIKDIRDLEVKEFPFKQDDGTTRITKRYVFKLVSHPDKTIICPVTVMGDVEALIDSAIHAGRKMVAFGVGKRGSGKDTKYFVSPEYE